MRDDVPSPETLRGARLWATATFVHATAGEVTVPVAGGKRIWQADQTPSMRVSGLVVPRVLGGQDLVRDGLVGSDGHRVEIRAYSDAWPSSWSLGTFLVEKTPVQDVSVTVDAVELRQLVIDHEAASPRGVFPGSSIRMILDELFAEDRVPLYFSRALGERVLPVGFALGMDRGAAVTELLTAWSAHMVPYRDGVLVKPVPAETVTVQPALRFTDGHGGTVIDAALELDRSTVWNHFRVRQHDSEFVAEAVQRTGMYGVGAFGWRSHPVIESDAIGGRAQAQAVAVTELAKARMRAVTVPVEAVSDPRVEGWDPVEVVTRDVSGWGRVTGFDVPVLGDEPAVYHVGLEV